MIFEFIELGNMFLSKTCPGMSSNRPQGINIWNCLFKYLIVHSAAYTTMITMYIETRLYRSSHSRCSVEKGVLKKFTKFAEKHLCQALFFNKVAALNPATLLKKRLWHRVFYWILKNFKEHLFYRTPPDVCFYSYLAHHPILLSNLLKNEFMAPFHG